MSKHPNRLLRALAACAVVSVVLSAVAFAADVPATPPTQQQTPAPRRPIPAPLPPKVEPASDDAEQDIAGFKLPQGFKATLFAAEPRLANPVAFHIDEKGRFFVVETFRFKHGVIDIRDVMDWLQDDTAAEKVADRVAMVRKWRGDPGVAEMEQYSDRIKLIEDRDHDGKADHDTVFADHYNAIEDGVASGVLARYGDVYFANVPSLYLLRDTNNDGRADQQQVLQYGYGTRYNFLGHDLHGLRFGPDGKLYFSMGDRGLNIERSVDGRLVKNVDHGAVLRCNPDGTELEIVHNGLRNPQELAFDQYGNLFTGDNNCDAGDQARWVYVVEGGDSGWREGYQSADFPVSRGPWMLEDVWKPQPKVPIYYRLPPIINPPVAGPSGLTYSPGTGMPPQYNHTFFLCDFRGGAAGGSGIYAIRNTPKGATFEAKAEPFVTNILPTDVEFGYDGGLYYTDWTGGWELPGKGRIYHIFEPQTAQATNVAETARLMAEGFSQRPANSLAGFLAHPDMRVRLEAQFALATKGAESISTFAPVAQSNANQLARLHAIWGLGQIARTAPDALNAVLPLLGDKDDEVRAQAAKVLGDAKYAGAYDGLLKALTDANARVRFFAAMGVGKIGRAEAVPAILNLLRENNDADPYLRHAGVMALVWLKDVPAIESAAKDSSKAVRIASLLAMRRLALPQVATFLNDADDEVVLEAARAIYDLPIGPALPKLAALVTQPKWSERKPLNEMVLVRALAANYRLGTPEAARALATYAASQSGNENYRVAALNMLGDWQAPKGRDYLTGLWRPLAPRDPAGAREAVQPVFAELLRNGGRAVQVAAAELTPKLGVEDPAVMFELATSTKFDPKVRAAALDALDAGKGDRGRLAEAVAAALKDADEDVRGAAIRLQAKLPGGVAKLQPLFEHGSARERQAVIAAVTNVKGDPAADAIVSAAMEQLLSGKLPPEMQLDALEAAAARKDQNPQIAKQLATFEASRKSETEDPLSHFREALAGGDAERGQKIFQLRADVSCIKCHSVKAHGGTAGPDLAGVGTRGSREYLLESILYPNKKIATGFETIALKTKSGVVTGVLKAEDAQAIQLDVPDKGTVTVRKADVLARKGGMSAMPEGFGNILSKRDLRDVVEYLANLK